ncbi:hypothetical protein BVX98_04360 [bacterium F11]|nr:hypothetical protein BVX98_04360 [bacterium F11]
MSKTEILNEEFSRFAGELAESFSFNRSIGQIYGLLYLSSEPLSLDQLSASLHMSKGNVSMNLKILRYWGAVQQVTGKSNRKDYYKANQNIKEVALRRFQEGIGRRLDRAEETLNRLLLTNDQNPDVAISPEAKRKLKELQSMVSGGRKALELIPKFIGFVTK